MTRISRIAQNIPQVLRDTLRWASQEGAHIKVSLVLAIFILLVAISTTGKAQEYNPGRVWLGANADHQLFWVWGAADGQSLLVEELRVDKKKRLENRLLVKDAQTISEIMTQYYGDPANTYIPWHYMAVVANMKLNGQSAAALDERLRLLREYAAFQRSKPVTK